MTELLRRGVELEIDTRAVTDDDRLALTVSSETEVDRGYLEVLSHAPESVNLSRLKDGGPVLWGHDHNQPIGVLDHVQLGGDRKLRVRMRWAKNARAKEIRQDVADGVIRGASIGYSIEQTAVEHLKDNRTRVTAIRWTPHEVSLVAVPADATVGVGRSAGFSSSTPPATTHRHMTTQAESPPDPAVRALSDERGRAAEITALAAEHGVSDRVPEWIRTGTAVADVRTQILQHVRGRVGLPTAAGSGSGPLGPDWSPRERSQYSLLRAIRMLAGEKVEAGFEREVSRDLSRSMGRDTSGLIIPFSVLTQRATLTSTGVNVGKETVFTELGEFVDMLRNRMLAIQLGARVLPGLQGNVAFPRQTGTGAATWMAEAPGSGVAATNLTLDQVTLTPKQLQSQTQLSRLVMIQSTPSIEEMVRQDLFDAHAVAIDLAVLDGTGASNQPTGILAATGTNAVAMGTNGAVPSLTKLLEAEKLVEDANAVASTASYVTTPGQRSKMRETQRFSGTNGEALWTDEEKILGSRAFATKQMPSNLTKGTSSGICHALIYGDFSQILIGMWGPGFELIVDPYTLANRNMVQITSYQTADVAVRRPAAFSVIKDLLV